jgi:hypothetical protein
MRGIGYGPGLTKRIRSIPALPTGRQKAHCAVLGAFCCDVFDFAFASFDEIRCNALRLLHPTDSGEPLKFSSSIAPQVVLQHWVQYCGTLYIA